MRKELWISPENLEMNKIREQFDKYFPRYYKMDYDPTCEVSGC